LEWPKNRPIPDPRSLTPEFHGRPYPPQPVKLLIALLSADPTLFTTAVTQLQKSYGPVDLESNVFPWNTTDYYREEMGENLLRTFVGFECLISPEDLARVKLETNALDWSFFFRRFTLFSSPSQP